MPKQRQAYETIKNDLLCEKFDLTNPLKEFKFTTSKIIILKDGKLLLSDPDGYIYIYDDTNFNIIARGQIFSSFVQDMIDLKNRSIAACSNDKAMKIFKNKNNEENN